MTGLISVVGGAVLDSLAEPARLLVARRTAPPQFAGMWEFPGGKVEQGETPGQALHRELLEELGITVRLGAELPAPTPFGWPLNERATMRVWFAELDGGRPRPLQDHDELRWIDLRNRGEVLGLPWIPADFPIVEALLDAVQDSGPAAGLMGASVVPGPGGMDCRTGGASAGNELAGEVNPSGRKPW